MLMTHRFSALTVIACGLSLSAPGLPGGEPWPQFRGQNASGVSLETAPLPAEIGPEKNVLWSVEIPPGVSSPVIWGEQIYLTGEREGKKLVTFSLSTDDGAVLWEKAAPLHEIEANDKKPKGRLATPSCATDGRRVLAFFGSSGLLCYDASGELLWHREMGPFKDRRGATSSPIIAYGKAVVLQDHEGGSFLATFDLATGKTVWHADRTFFARSYNTPVVWQPGVKPLLAAAGSGLLTVYDFKTGRVEWIVRGTSSVANATAVADRAGRLFVASANPGPKREGQLTFEQLVERDDADSNGKLEHAELKTGFLNEIFPDYDTDSDGVLSKAEHDSIHKYLTFCQNGMLAVSGVKGDAFNRTETATLWQVKKGIPRTASPIYYDGHLYCINDGGVFVSLNADTGKIVKMARTPGSGKYFGSPVLGDGKIYFASDRGEVTVVSAEPEWEVLFSDTFGEPCYPSPAISGGRVYVRTESKLFCFSVK
jgi:outer membrane protein assembly factor BamB